jgi:hypothetical protein
MPRPVVAQTSTGIEHLSRRVPDDRAAPVRHRDGPIEPGVPVGWLERGARPAGEGYCVAGSICGSPRERPDGAGV